MTDSAPTIFESFNARSLNPSQVARTFVPSEHYTSLSKRRHTVIVGPRGSGKTTLLKMLQQLALEAWHHPVADDFRSRIDFTGVFIPTDLSWGHQIEALGEGQLDVETHTLLSKAIFTTHVLRALVIAMLSRIDPIAREGTVSFRRVKLSNDAEARAAKLMCQAWHLSDLIPTFLSVKQALSFRLSAIRELASREAVLGTSGRSERLGGVPYLHLHFLQSSGIAIEVFEDCGQCPPEKWALMFDELELAPGWIQDELVRSLRSTDERFLFKLALNPYNHDSQFLRSPLSAAPDQDFDQIPLWYAEKRDGYSFCADLWGEMLREKGLGDCSPNQCLGTSYFETPVEEWRGFGTAYRPGSKMTNRFAALAARDRSFQAYLTAKEIDLKKLDSYSGDERAAELRKIGPLIAVRDFYRRADVRDGEAGSRRSRKLPVLYAGADSLFAISEGNPRWFIALVGRLLDRMDRSRNRISPAAQAREMLLAAQKFSAMLRTVPLPAGAIDPARGLLTIINGVARFFHTQVVVEEFRAEPPATFIVDSNTSNPLLASLGQALNAGALVYVPDDPSQLILTSLRGKRFRVTYLLAPLYGLPLRLGKEIMLSTIMKHSEQRPASLPLFLTDDEQ
jgi:energy-coupling factor transporter ATP-binding protein EcfA2